MKHKSLLIFLIVSLFSCNNVDNELIFQQLQGDWKDKYGENVFSFYDSTCSYLFPTGGEFTNFFINDDTLYCYPITRDMEKYDFVKFRILNLKGDSLRLSVSYRSEKKDTIDLIKTKNILGNDVLIDSIKLQTISGLGYYPTMKLYIDRKGNFIYEGKRDVSIIGSYKGTINESQLNFLENKFRCIDYKKIISNPIIEGDFIPITTIEIYVRNNTSDYRKSFVIHNFLSLKEPAELRIFINYVMSMYKYIHLTAIDNEEFIRSF
jgi:hypothetical protein